MNRTLCLGLTAMLICLCSSLCSGQGCTDGFTATTFQCVYDGSCSSSVTVYTPNESQDGVTVHCGAVDCCGHLFTTCWGDGNCEAVKKLGDPAARKRLARLAGESEVLVADCRGRYALYRPTPTVATRRTLALVDDHILR